MISESKKIRLTILLKPLSDLEFQRHAWIDNFGEAWDSYAEVYMTFFEISEPIIADSEGYQLTGTKTFTGVSGLSSFGEGVNFF